MGDKKKKNKDDKKKNKKKSKSEKNKDKEKQSKKKKSEKKSRSSSNSSNNSSDSSGSRSRKKEEKTQGATTKKDRQKSNEKPKKQNIHLPFEIGSKPITPPVVTVAPISTLRPGMMPPPAPPPASTTTSNKPKTKQYHIFKLLPRLPVGCVTLGKTLYSSSFLSSGFEQKMFSSLCEQVEKSAKAEGSKKMASAMSKIRNEINSMETKQKDENKDNDTKFENQFQVLNELFISEKNRLKQQYCCKQKKLISSE